MLNYGGLLVIAIRIKDKILARRHVVLH